jgi:hypothetical protein
MKRESINRFFVVSLFAIAMGFLETTVVLYLRALYYPNGFDFPLSGFIDPNILGIEWIREFATIVMLVTLAMLAGKKFYDRFAYFLFAFAVWDIFYYIFLKLFLNWPSSIFTWDILFLIPLPWIGPVIAPVICALIMILMAFLLINFQDKGYNVKIRVMEWTLFVIGMLFVLYTWLYDYGRLIIGGGFSEKFFSLANDIEFYNIISSYVPSEYNWSIYTIGVVLAAIGVALFYIRTKKHSKK